MRLKFLLDLTFPVDVGVKDYSLRGPEPFVFLVGLTIVKPF